MKRLILFALLTILGCGLFFAQAKEKIKGQVLDQEGNPVSEVRVEVVEADVNTITQPDGSFILEHITQGKIILLFSHPDYIKQSIEIDSKAKSSQKVEITLTPRSKMLLIIKEEITVTAEADSIIDVNLPSHRTILPSSVLTEMGAANVAEAVDKVPGVTAVGKGGYSMVPAIRGLAEHRVLLLVDGIRITSERRIGSSASFINLNDIDRIEINRGPYSVFHGSGAVGGIINIVTKSPSIGDPLKGAFQLSYNTAKEERAAFANLRGAWKKWSFMLSANGKKADDYSSPEGKIVQSYYSDYDLFMKVRKEGKNSQLYFTFLHYRGTDIGKPSPSSKFKPRWYPKEKNTLFSLGYSVQNKFQLDNLNASLYVLQTGLETQKDNLNESLIVEKRNLAEIDGINFGLKVRGGRSFGQYHNLNFGIDFFGREDINDRNIEWIFDENGTTLGEIKETSLQDARRSNFGIYIDDKIQLASFMTMNLGARFDYIRTSNFLCCGKRDVRSDKSWSAYIGTIFQLSPSVSFLANLGRSLRFPSVSELFYTGLTGRGTVFGNPSLLPEKSVNFDLGFRCLHEKFFLAVYGFNNTVSDMIQKYSESNKEEYYYSNLARGRITGIEGEFYLALMREVEVFINFHHMKGKDKESQMALNYIAPSRLALWAKFSLGCFWIEPKFTFAAAKKDPGPLEMGIAGYSLVEMIIGCRPHKTVELLAIAQNILNKTYRLSADALGVIAPGRGIVIKAIYSF